jgi:tRNA pseudouridine32 synthase/23S rRNA pseudouridine746 synthase
MNTSFVFKGTIDSATSQSLCDYLAQHTGLSKGKVKDAMGKGAVWLARKGGKRRRLRRVSTLLGIGDGIEFYYDQELLEIEPPSPRCVNDLGRYSVWFKPASLMAQGTDRGDHCSLLRRAELYFHPRRQVFLVHRLDRETAGLMLIAHDSQTAARLSSLFRENRIKKHYRVRVSGALKERRGEIDLPLDGKRALTRYSIVDYDATTRVTTLDVIIDTGRRHQIRRHLAMVDHPVIGDPKYGSGNKNREGLQLAAVGLSFRCPLSGKERDYAVPDGFDSLL